MEYKLLIVIIAFSLLTEQVCGKPFFWTNEDSDENSKSGDLFSEILDFWSSLFAPEESDESNDSSEKPILSCRNCTVNINWPNQTATANGLDKPAPPSSSANAIQPSNVGNQPIIPANPPSNSVNQPASPSSQPVSSTSQTAGLASPPANAGAQPTGSQSQPANPVSQPEVSNSQPATGSNSPGENPANAIPQPPQTGGTSGQPSNPADQSANAAGQPANTAAQQNNPGP